jgi:hypothetical protein
MMLRTATASTSVLFVSLLAACGSMSPMKPIYSQANLPATVQVPTGNKVAMETVGVGEITYQCSAKKDMAGQFEWVFVGPDAKLNDRSGKQVGKYYGPPGHGQRRHERRELHPARGHQRRRCIGHGLRRRQCGRQTIVKYQADYIFYKAM